MKIGTLIAPTITIECFIEAEMANGFSSAINAALSSMNDTSQKTIIKAGNIANSETPGYKAFQSIASSLITGSSSSSSGVSSTVRQLIDQQGTPLPTGVTTDLSIQNAGFFVVEDGNGAYSLSRLGSFRKDKDGDFVDPTGTYKLQAWLLDSSGNLPENKSLITSLSSVNVNKLVSNATPTSSVNVGLNLNPQQTVVGGGSATIHISDTGAAASKYNYNLSPNQTIYPNPLTSLTKGEGIQISLGSNNMQAIYGGFLQTLSLTNAGTDLVQNGGALLASDFFNVQVGTNNIPAVSRGNGATNLAVLQNIADQLNASTGSLSVVARVINDGTNSSLLIAPNDANSSLTFSGNSVFRNSIGIDDSKNILAFTANSSSQSIGRFASLQNLSDLLTAQKISSSAYNSDSFGTNLTIESDKVLRLTNFNPANAGSDFLSEFGIAKGYLHSTYSPYDSANNMAGKTNSKFTSAYTSDVTAYNPQGIGANLLIGVLKVDTDKFAIEVFAADPSGVTVAGRTDGLLMAGIATFDGNGYLEALDAAAQNSHSIDISSPNDSIGATVGQTLTVATGNTVYTYTYGESTATTSLFVPTATGLAGAAADVFTVTVGTTLHSFTRGGGATNLEVLRNLESQINATSGGGAATAVVEKDTSSGKYRLIIRSADPSQAVSFGQSGVGNFGTDIGITATNNITANSFKSIYDLAQQINTSAGADAMTADVITGVEANTYRLRLAPTNPSHYLVFDGSSQPIVSPLGNGSSQTIASALGLQSTSAATQIPGLTDSMVINWADSIGANPNTISFNWGTIGTIDGLGQIAGDYKLKSITQNGSTTGAIKHDILIDSSPALR